MYDRKNSPATPAPTSSSTRPRGTPSPCHSDGETSRKRSRHMPANATTAIVVSPRGLVFTARLRSTTNGMTNAIANTVHATGAHAPCMRW